MQAREIMTKDIISVRPDTLVRDVAALMTEKRISGVPVLQEDGMVLGIVSQSDLLHRREIGTDPKRSWWLKVFSDPDKMAREYSKSHGLKAKDVMSRHLVSVSEDTDLGEVAAILDRNRIKRLPVLRDGKLVGLVSRSDLVKAFSQATGSNGVAAVGNAALQKTLSEKMRAETWLNTSFVNVIVVDGTVQLWGLVGSNDQRRALKVLVEETPGVKAIEDHLGVGYPARDMV